MATKTQVTPQEEIWNYILGFTHIALVRCAIELEIPDILENCKFPIVDLATKIRCSQSSLHRVMRFLVHNRVFQEISISETSVGYVKTQLSTLLTRHGPHSMADLVLLTSSPTMLAPWNKLSAWVLGSKELPFEAAHGKDLWEFSEANPDHNKLFNDGMACDARVAVGAVLEGCPEVFEGLRTVVDVGGGDGTALRLIVAACPWIKGVNFDLPHVVKVAPMSKGVEHVGGNMFDHIPKAEAVYMMEKFACRNYCMIGEIEDCITILQKCREAISQDKGKVIIVDVVFGRQDEHEFKGVGLMCDLNMMVYTNNGKECTLEEWSHLFHKSGFTLYAIKHIRAPQSIIEVYP